MKRKVKTKVQGFRTIDGAGVNLIRVLGNNSIEEFDPILMLDSFDSTDPKEYTAGFPMHPHRGMETISYLYKGKMVHRDSLGNEESIEDGEVQWMNSGSGILHEEMVPASERLLGVQLWLNLPKKDKMSAPSYHSIKNKDIQEIKFDSGFLRLLAGSYKEYKGYKGKFLPLDYYDIHLEKNAEFNLDTNEDESIILFTLLGNIYIENELVTEKTAVKLTKGDTLTLKSDDKDSQILLLKTVSLGEPVAWAGPIVMNTRDEIHTAYEELRNGNFVKEESQY